MNRSETHIAGTGQNVPVSGAALSVSERYCINLRGRLDACDLCQRVCHAQAISLSLDEVVIDAALCVGCGACVPACPAGAITHDGFDPEAFLETARGERTVRIGCAQTPDEAVVVPCHRMIDARIVAGLFAEGVAEIQLAGTENCHGCPSGDAHAALAVATRTIRKWFDEDAPRVVAAGTDRGDQAASADARRATERRHLLRGAFRSLSSTQPQRLQDQPRDMPSFDDLIRAGDAGEDAVARPVPYQQALAARRGALPFHADGPVGATGRSIGEGCSGCMICADLCPTGALSGLVEPGRRAVSFDPAKCTNCTLCLKVCPMDVVSARALRGVSAVNAGRSILFARVDRICAECSAAFDPGAGNDATCPNCRKDKEMDDEWLEMLSG